ncbi:MAG: SRPBCC domain-containing protein [Chitinophaga sp.]|uniref:SRPBCC domain-containing protein n=1 Tax=Chitinophaga sp. TaxID=1869181 RepID=UPI001B18E639|nr:SRPBCC domain-containing protein [Chitinophaga sp.]MBO9731403.1 SRPBCC domain-containing protein [Chitinophaga sp.]
MELKTKIDAADGQQDLTITREFELPVELLFKAYEEPAIVEQWMGTKVLKLENKKYGGFSFETTDPKGNTFGMSGTIHEFRQNESITRTFEMANSPFSVQLEFLQFESLSADTSKLTMHIIYKSNDHRDLMLKMGMTKGINMAHNRLQETVNKLK